MSVDKRTETFFWKKRYIRSISNSSIPKNWFFCILKNQPLRHCLCTFSPIQGIDYLCHPKCFFVQICQSLICRKTLICLVLSCNDSFDTHHVACESDIETSSRSFQCQTSSTIPGSLSLKFLPVEFYKRVVPRLILFSLLHDSLITFWRKIKENTLPSTMTMVTR